MSGLKEIRAVLESLFTEPKAYSRVTHTPIYYSDLGEDTGGVNFPFKSALYINNQVPPEKSGEFIRHESAHELVKPILSKLASIISAPQESKTALRNEGYQGVLPFSDPSNRQTVNETLGYATGGSVPGMGTLGAETTTGETIPTMAAAYLQNMLTKMKGLNPNISSTYTRLMNPQDVKLVSK